MLGNEQMRRKSQTNKFLTCRFSGRFVLKITHFRECIYSQQELNEQLALEVRLVLFFFFIFHMKEAKDHVCTGVTKENPRPLANDTRSALSG